MPPLPLTSSTHSWLPALIAAPRFLKTPLVSPMIPSEIVVSVTPLSVLTPPAPVAPAPVSAVLPHAASRSASAPAARPSALVRPRIIVVPFGIAKRRDGGRSRPRHRARTARRAPRRG